MRELLNRHSAIVRAETRQAASTLLMVGAFPRYPLPLEISQPEEVESFVRRFDWGNPWTAASHLAHALVFLCINYKAFGGPPRYHEITDRILSFLESVRDHKSGTWFTRSPSPAIKVNGAMKVLTGLQWLGRQLPDCRALIDFALAQPFESDGCGFLNRFYVVAQSVTGCPPGYRDLQVRALAERVVEHAGQYYRDDGGFSFYPTRAQTHYYGARVSNGNNLADLHGTVMLSWALALAYRKLELPGAKVWSVPNA